MAIAKVITPVFQASFVNLLAARSMKGDDGSQGKPKFGLTAIWTPAKFSEGDKRKWQAMGGLVNDACMAKHSKPYAHYKDLGNFKKAIRDGAEKDGYKGFGADTKFASLTTQNQPQVLDADGATLLTAANSDKLYSGAYFRATVNAYGYNNKGIGVALGLMSVQWVAHGERLDNRTTAQEDFSEDHDMGWMQDAVSASAEEIPF